MNRLKKIGLLIVALSHINCTNSDEINSIDVRYEFVNSDSRLNWKLNDGKYSYTIQHHFNSRHLENKINEFEINAITDSIAMIDDDKNNLNNNQEIIKNQYHSLNKAKSFDQFKINDLIVSSEIHYYWTERNSFTMPYEIHLNKDYQVKVNIEAGQHYPLELTATDYAGGYEFILEPRDVKLYRMIQSKFSEEKLKTDSARVNSYGHQIVVNNTIVNNNPKTIYYNRDYSSLIMFTDYLILKYIRELKPTKIIYPIQTLRKPLEPETIN